MKKFPHSIAFVVTSKCNLRCKMCFQYGLRAQRLGIKDNPILPPCKELVLSGIKEIVSKINRNYSRSNKPSFYITGGEPFVRKDMFDIICYLHNQGNEIVVNTNFSLVNKNLLKKLANLKNLYLVVSLDGPQKIHDSIRGVKGLYKKVIGNLRFYSEKGGNHVRINCTIFKDNVGYIVDLYKALRGLNIHFCLNNVTWIDEKHIKIQEQLNKKYFGLREGVYLSKDLTVPLDKIRVLKKEFVTVGKMAKKDKINVFQIGARYETLKNYYTNFNCNIKNRTCRTHNPTILPNGDVRFCPGVTYGIGPVLGNLLKDSLADVLKKRRKIEKIVNKRFRMGFIFPVCVKCCFLKDKNEYSLLNKLKRRVRGVFPDGANPRQY